MKQNIINSLKKSILKIDSSLSNNIFLDQIKLDKNKNKLHGDLSCNIAMLLAKTLKKSPLLIAEQIISKMEASDNYRCEIAAPGFINFFLSTDYLISSLTSLEKIDLGSTHIKKKVVIDYSSPNLAKEMHVGHLRSSIIGDSLVRIFSESGFDVIKQNHIGDWGTQFGMLLAYMDETKRQDIEGVNLQDLESFYKQAKKRFDESEDFANKARGFVVKMQSLDEHCTALWRDFRSASLAHCNEVYQDLGLLLTDQDVRGESFYHNLIPELKEFLIEKNILVKDQGSYCAFLQEFADKTGKITPIIFQKQDGGFLYAASDLAAVQYRAKELQADHIYYVVDIRQALHFKQIFALSKKAGIVDDGVILDHIGFGTMNGSDGKPFKTRAGDTFKLIDLLKQAKQKALQKVREKNPDLPESEAKHIADTIGVAAIKYSDLSKNRLSNYNFNIDEILSFDGNTAPYLLYALTRIKKILSKAAGTDFYQNKINLTTEYEIDLANKLLHFFDCFKEARDKLMPHLLCVYLYELSTVFSVFYEKSPVLSDQVDLECKLSRLKLLKLTENVFEKTLFVLGINWLEKM